jgi:hypothetical protein
MVSYDDAKVSFKKRKTSSESFWRGMIIIYSIFSVQSFAAKGKFIRDTKLRGFAMWEAGGDYNDILLDAIREAAGGYGAGSNTDSSLSLNLPLIGNI